MKQQYFQIFSRIAGSLLGTSLFILPSAAVRPPQKNVIVILTDDQGYGDFSINGNPRLKTPNIDEFAKSNIRFTDFHATPMSTSSRGELMTGVNAIRNGAMMVCSGYGTIRQDIPTMAEIFRENGYETGIFGKWHLGMNYPDRPSDRGFNEALVHGCWGITSVGDYWNNDYFDDVYSHNNSYEQYNGYCTDVWFQETKRWIRKNKTEGKPFLAYLALNAPHTPLYVPQEYSAPYADLGPRVANFFGMIANIDNNLGSFIEFLKMEGLYENTIVLFMTDNGGTAATRFYNAGMKGRKCSIYEGGHRVPLFMHLPDSQKTKPAEIDELVSIRDVLPTLADLCSIKPRKGIEWDGISLKPLLTQNDKKSLDNRFVVVQIGNQPMYSLTLPTKWDACTMWKKWRLVGKDELYNIEEDPGQIKNVAAIHKDIIGKMQKQYESWWEKNKKEISPTWHLIGTGKQDTVLLTSHDWMAPNTADQYQIRRGVNRSGAWNVETIRDGIYEFSLYRWPKEAGAALRDSLPSYKGTTDTFTKGLSKPIHRANIRIGNQEYTRTVAPGAHSANFEIYLKKGRNTIQTWFYDANMNQLSGAYYVYITLKEVHKE